MRRIVIHDTKCRWNTTISLSSFLDPPWVVFADLTRGGERFLTTDIRLVWAPAPPAVSWGNDSCQLHFLILFVRRNSIGTFGLITHNRTRKTHTKAHNTMNRYTTAITLSITALWPPNNTNSAIDILIGESYGYSVMGARLMVVERGPGDEKKSGADSYADQIFGDGFFEGNTWTNKPTRIPLES